MSRTKLTVLALSVLLSGAAISHQMPAQNQPLINVPYRCANGITYTVLNCKPYRADQWCRTTEEQNGNLVTTFDSAWSSMPGRLQGCTTAPVSAHQAAPAASSQSPSAAPELGVYHCTNGFTLTISKCGKLSGRDACTFKMEDRGKVLIDAPGTAVDVEKILRACQSGRTATQSAVPSAGTSISTNPATPSSDYVSDMPSVERVKSEIRGTDLTDTLARQRAVFTYLAWYIGNIKYARTVTGPYTPSERKIVSAYQLAAYQIEQDYKKTHTPAEFQAFQQLSDKYGITEAPGWIKPLVGQKAADTYRGAEASLAQTHMQQQEQMQKQFKEQHRNFKIAGDPVLDPTGMFAGLNTAIEDDPDVRRCLELGGSLDECKGSEVLGAMAGWLGAGAVVSRKSQVVSGVAFVGGFRDRSGTGIDFASDLGSSPIALIVNCGNLVSTPIADGREYKVRKAGNSVQFVVANQPQPIVLTMQPGGNLLGPGSVLVKGRVITGYTTTTRTAMVNGARADLQGYDCNGPCSTSSSIPNYAPRIERCTIGSLATLPMRPPEPNTIPKSGIGMIDALTKSKPLVTGFRMAGRYEGTAGLTLDFGNDAVTLDCGKAHAKVPYVVDNTSAGFVVRVQNSAGAFLLSVSPGGGTLHGSGSTAVNGKLVSSIREESVSFTPYSESCRIDTFTAGAERERQVGFERSDARR